jgi:ADP-ribose pyrophosphatase YjhB (NUDIX family)
MAGNRRTARAIVRDAGDQLVLIRRTRPDQPPYWTTPGGGIEETGPSVEAANALDFIVSASRHLDN